MEIICESCQSKFRIGDEKLPKDKTAFLKCPKCQNRISVPALAKDPDDPGQPDVDEDFFSFDEDESDGYDVSDKPFDFVEEEGKTALLCESDPMIIKAITPVLEVLEYHITEVKNSREALKTMRYHSYDLIVVNEYFDAKNPDANGVLIYLERLHMSVRRNIFLTLITRRFRTMDNMAAFQKSVNMIVNVDNIADFDKILRRGMADFGIFYQAYKDCLA
ncbi:zinc-ribbon domain-containing protein [Desulfosarcina sp.]|uniref:zinc-ribbon domain-containing protein n=1 Tax=Desulfosarcina sp. TaxID=2027861 RepID=UPI0029BB1351|nr:zinc-ribbon domain-containing protein [Desulfosarcina sp.]MDX2453610.1 zinc-ribbon domain-containing protein [Desulfosarcina sp.]MDX2491317.1 zinc-ribbon domain-containing protein [Desulfosarcina sp.]